MKLHWRKTAYYNHTQFMKIWKPSGLAEAKEKNQCALAIIGEFLVYGFWV